MGIGLKAEAGEIYVCYVNASPADGDNNHSTSTTMLPMPHGMGGMSFKLRLALSKPLREIKG